MTSVITKDQIEYLIDFIKPQKGIPIKTAESFMELNKNLLREQLIGQEIYPELLFTLKSEIFKNWKNTQIQPGESVGVVCAQSIGEKNTQTALNTFHKAGQSEKTMTEGVPRFQELLNATKNPKVVNHKIFFRKGTNSIKDLRNIVQGSINGCTINDISNSFEIILDYKTEEWHKTFEILYGKSISNFTECIRIKLNKKKMYENKIDYELICEKIEDIYIDVTCAFTPVNDGYVYVFPETENVKNILNEHKIGFINDDNCIEIFFEDVVKPAVEKVELCGINGIKEIFYTRDNGEWFIETNSENNVPDKTNIFNKILTLEIVDENKSLSNNIWEIYKTLGIEATKVFLLEEFMSIMEGINICHGELLVDRMTFNGTIESISRYTLKNDNCGPLGKASFEESLDNFLSAAISGEVEPTTGVSASIICGKRSNIGTGMMSIKMDIK